MRRIINGIVLVTVALLTWSVYANDTYGAGGHQHEPSAAVQEETPKAPIRMTMEELHKTGGVPPGWKFALPAGDPKKGRQIFVRLECYTCHAVQGESFPAAPNTAGPDLTAMGAYHPAAYFAETIINPNRVIVVGKGYTGSDGLSTMPSYNDALTVAELVDLVAYLKSLRGEMKHKAMEHPGKH